MTRREERELIDKIRRGDTIAREKLIIETSKFAKYIAKDYWQRGAFFEFEDLLQECNIGLIRAVDRIAKIGLRGGNRFVSYANIVMRNQIRKLLRTQNWPIKSNRDFFLDQKANALFGAITHSYDNTGFNFMVIQDHTPGRLALHDKLIDIMDDFLTFEEEDIIKLKYGFGHIYFDTPDWQKPNKPLTREKISKITTCSIKKVLVLEERAMKKLQTTEVQTKLLAWL